VPKDVAIQVLTQSRSELIRRTFDAIAGRHGRSCIFTTRPPSCSAASCSGRIVPESSISR
jgi:hypothetical protein